MVKISTKKITAVAMTGLVLASPFAAFAEEENETVVDTTEEEVDTTDLEEELEEIASDVEDEESESETEEVELDETEEEDFSTSEGAQLRWEHFVSRVEARAENSVELLAELPEDTQVNVERLEEISVEFERIAEEAASLVASDLDRSELAHLYVDYKKEMITLSQEFKQEFTQGLTEDKKEELREKVKAKKEEVKERRAEKIDNLRKKVNMATLATAYSHISGLELEEIRAQYEAGELTIEEVKAEVKETWENLSDEEKEEAKEKLKEERAKFKVEAKERAKEIRENHKERLIELKEERKEQLDVIRERYQNRVQEIRKEVKERRADLRVVRAQANQGEFNKIQERFNNLPEDKQEELKQKAEELTLEERDRLLKAAGKFLEGEDLNTEDIAEITKIVEDSGLSTE